ncbi:MAG: GNAT family N-acetyltransferase [Rhodobacteraceae bacterium]|nr:GNAT family N-acetyltransferase [Paracoccaceae bacterium]
MSYSGYLVAPYRPALANQVVTFFSSAHRLDPTLRPLSHAQWTAFASHADWRDFLLLASHDGTVVAVMTTQRVVRSSQPIRHFCIYVAPELRRSGIASFLLREVESLDNGRALPTLECRLRSDWMAGTGFLRHYGFRPWKTWIDLRADLKGRAPARAISGFWLRTPHLPGEAPAMAHLSKASHNVEVTPDAASFAELSDDPDRDALIVVDGDRLVGFIVFEPDDGGLGWVDNIVIAPAYRQRGLGRWLMEAALIHIGVHASEVTLQCEAKNAPALALYRSLNFHPTGGSTIYVREHHHV